MEQGPMDVQKECRPMSGSGVEAFTNAEGVSCEMLPNQPSLSSSTDSPASPACLDAQHTAIDTHTSELSLHSNTSKANMVGGMDLSLLHCEPSLLSINSLRMSSSQEGRVGQDSGHRTICESHTTRVHISGRELQPEEMESPRLLCRIGLSKLSLGGNESETQTDQPDKPVVIGRKRRRGCQTSQRTSGRISKHAKRELDKNWTASSLFQQKQFSHVQTPLTLVHQACFLASRLACMICLKKWIVQFPPLHSRRKPGAWQDCGSSRICVHEKQWRRGGSEH